MRVYLEIFVFKHHGMSEDGFLYVYVVEGQGQTMYVYPVFSVSYYHFVIYFFHCINKRMIIWPAFF